MFRLASNPSFTHEVEVSIPVDGGFETHMLKTRFRVLTLDAFERHDLTSLEGQRQLLDQAVAEFLDVVDDDGRPIAHSDRLKAQLIAIPFVRKALLDAYPAALMGARRKNSGTPRPPGPAAA